MTCNFKRVRSICALGGYCNDEYEKTCIFHTILKHIHILEKEVRKLKQEVSK